jgi:hypothetical protein
MIAESPKLVSGKPVMSKAAREPFETGAKRRSKEPDACPVLERNNRRKET